MNTHPATLKCVLNVLGLMLWLQPSLATAQVKDDRMPQSRIGTVFALRENLGSLASSYERGAALGFEAGYLFYLGDTGIGLGPVSTTLFKGWYLPNGEQVVDDLLEISELSLGLRIRRLAGESSFGFLSVGGTLLRTEIPTDTAKSKRLHHGFYVGAGIERFVMRRFYIAIEMRYDSVVSQSPSATALISLSVGR